MIEEELKTVLESLNSKIAKAEDAITSLSKKVDLNDERLRRIITKDNMYDLVEAGEMREASGKAKKLVMFAMGAKYSQAIADQILNCATRCDDERGVALLDQIDATKEVMLRERDLLSYIAKLESYCQH